MRTMSEEIEWQTAVARVVDLMMALTETLVFQWKPRDFEVSFATVCALTPLSTFSSWNFLRHSGILKRQALEQYDDPEILPMHNLLGRMSALDGNFVFFSNHHAIVVAINLQTLCAMNDRHLGFVLQCDTSPMNHLRRQLQPFLKKAGLPYVALEKTHGRLT